MKRLPTSGVDKWDAVYGYDQLFQSLIKRNPKRSWAIKQTDWYMDKITESKALENADNKPKQSQVTNQEHQMQSEGSSNQQNKHKEICNKYQQLGHCPFSKKCSREHKCVLCGKPGHGAIKCFRRSGDQGVGSQAAYQSRDLTPRTKAGNQGPHSTPK